MKTKGDKFRLHHSLMTFAREEAEKAIEEEDGEKCFNLFEFLEGLSYRLESVLNDDAVPTGRFELGADNVARYLWCCLALEHGDRPDGTTFKGMPILD